MLKLSLTIPCLLMTCLLFRTALSQGRTCGNLPNNIRQTCGGDTRAECANFPMCCWAGNRCVLDSNPRQLASAMKSLSEVEAQISVPDRPSTQEVARVFRRTTGILSERRLISQQSANAVTGRIGRRNFLGLLIDFPQCAVETPFCHRTYCNRQNPNSESDPLVCLRNPQCCFDKDLYLYKAIFGPNFMGGAPVCYNGPTSSRYRFLTDLIKPWNPFYQQATIGIFEDLFDNAILNFNVQITCRVTNFLSGISILQTPKCGWEGITRLQCHLKGCCYNDGSNECNYPSEGNNIFGFSTPSQEIYPELERQPYDEFICGQDRTFTPNIFRRLPCRCNANNATLTNFILGCPQGRCCPNLLALFPEIADLTLISGGFTQSQLTINPAFLLSPFFSGFNRASISSLYCPYFFLPLPGFPDLTGSVLNCCKQQPCYHLKGRSSGGGVLPPVQPRANWNEWERWGPCTGPPCNGRRTRQRRCLDSRRFNSNICPGSSTESESCTTPQCCTWDNWSQYSPCIGPCGRQGSQTRNRQCRCTGGQFPSNCRGQGQESRSCQTLCPPAWTAWLTVQRCNAPCGQSGSIFQRRECRRNGNPASGCQGRRERRQPCQGPVCPASWTAWVVVGRCRASCGQNGFQQRRRECRNNRGGLDNTCPGPNQDQVQCRGPPCPSSWSKWSPYGACNAPCGRNGQQTRTRRCEGPNGAQGSGCPGQSVESRICQGSQCPSAWTRWSPFGECTGPCSGPRTRTRVRRCQRPNGTPANNCPGSATETRPCQQISCYAYTDWSPYTPCMSSCTRQRSRYCRDIRSNDPVQNSNCGSNSEPVERSGCVGGTCVPAPPEPWVSWGEWLNWTGCSQTCGRGQRTRERLCLYRGRADSPIDSALCICAYGPDAGASQDVACNTDSCNQYDWAPWSECTRCTTGNSRRSRRCVRANGNQQVSSRLCDGPDTETIPCNPQTGTCIGWSAWSTYTTDCACPAGTFERVRCRITGSRECFNAEYEYRNCPPGSCPSG